MTEPDEVVALIATVINDIRTPDDPEGAARAVRDALDEAGLLLHPGAGGTSEHPELVRQVLNGDEVRKAVYALAASVVDARCERWREQGRNEERLRALSERNADV